MADVFISHHSSDGAVAEKLAAALEKLGCGVRWNSEQLAREDYTRAIPPVIDQSRAVIVLWSARAIASDQVLEEASYALAKGKLVAARIEDVRLPPVFGGAGAADLVDWHGEGRHAGLSALLGAVQQRAGPAPAPEPAPAPVPPPPAPLRLVTPPAPPEPAPPPAPPPVAPSSANLFAHRPPPPPEPKPVSETPPPAKPPNLFSPRPPPAAEAPMPAAPAGQDFFAPPPEPAPDEVKPQPLRRVRSEPEEAAEPEPREEKPRRGLFRRKAKGGPKNVGFHPMDAEPLPSLGGLPAVAPPPPPVAPPPAPPLPPPSRAAEPPPAPPPPPPPRPEPPPMAAPPTQEFPSSYGASYPLGTPMSAVRRSAPPRRQLPIRPWMLAAAGAGALALGAIIAALLAFQRDGGFVEPQLEPHSAAAEAGGPTLVETPAAATVEAPAEQPSARTEPPAQALPAAPASPPRTATSEPAAAAAPAPVAEQEAPAAPSPNAAADDAAFDAARAAHTVEAYAGYLDRYPNGRNARAARAARQVLIGERIETQTGTLEPGLRAIVGQARRAASEALAAAERAREGGGAGLTSRRLADGRRYEGEWSEGGANGYGRALAQNGQEYVGAWRGSLRAGAGVLLFPNGVKFEGEFVDDAPTSRGVYWDAQGRRVVGSAAVFDALVGR